MDEYTDRGNQTDFHWMPELNRSTHLEYQLDNGATSHQPAKTIQDELIMEARAEEFLNEKRANIGQDKTT